MSISHSAWSASPKPPATGSPGARPSGSAPSAPAIAGSGLAERLSRLARQIGDGPLGFLPPFAIANLQGLLRLCEGDSRSDGPRAIAVKKGVTVLHMTSSKMLGADKAPVNGDTAETSKA